MADDKRCPMWVISGISNWLSSKLSDPVPTLSAKGTNSLQWSQAGSSVRAGPIVPCTGWALGPGPAHSPRAGPAHRC